PSRASDGTSGSTCSSRWTAVPRSSAKPGVLTSSSTGDNGDGTFSLVPSISSDAPDGESGFGNTGGGGNGCSNSMGSGIGAGSSPAALLSLTEGGWARGVVRKRRTGTQASGSSRSSVPG